MEAQDAHIGIAKLFKAIDSLSMVVGSYGYIAPGMTFVPISQLCVTIFSHFVL